jgi:hypothetical protein
MLPQTNPLPYMLLFLHASTLWRNIQHVRNRPISQQRAILMGSVRMSQVTGVNAIELARMMEDQAARFDSMGRLQKRNFILQQLLTRVQGLSDEDFESAFATFSSMVSTLELRRKKLEDEKEKANNKPKDLIQEVNKKVTQNRGTTI